MEKDIISNQDNRTQKIADVVFLNQHSNYYIFKKVSKVSEALYLLSDLLSSSEPLRMSLRKIAHGLLESFSSYKTGVVPENLVPIFMVLERQINLGVMSSLISTMNSEILKNEIENIVFEIKNMSGKSGVLFPEIGQDFFKVETMLQSKTEENYKGQISHNVLYEREKSFRNNSQNFKKPNTESGYPLKDKNLQLVTKDDRKNKIINIIKESLVPVTIKDITAKIKDCSEKTIQRELIELLDKGSIKKTGERRWSKYFI